MANDLDWVATVIGEYGGPMLVCAETDYMRWSGSLPLPLAHRRTLHYWGQFTAKLPPPYAQDGGHVFRPHEDADALEADLDALLDAIRGKWPKATIAHDEEHGAVDVELTDGRRMRIELSPMSAYDRVCEALDLVAVEAFATLDGLSGCGVFWEKEGAGLVDVGIGSERDELVLLRSWVNSDDDVALARAHVARVDADSEEPLDTSYRIAERRVVVAYSPEAWLTMLPAPAFQAAREASDRDAGRAALEAAFRGLTGDVEREARMLDGADDRDVACVVALEPGEYRVSTGDHEEGEWSAIWCRLRRVR